MIDLFHYTYAGFFHLVLYGGGNDRGDDHYKLTDALQGSERLFSGGLEEKELTLLKRIKRGVQPHTYLSPNDSLGQLKVTTSR